MSILAESTAGYLDGRKPGAGKLAAMSGRRPFHLPRLGLLQ